MTTTDTDLAPDVRRLTQAQLAIEAVARFGTYPAVWLFRCIRCGHVQQAADLPPGRRGDVAQACWGCGFLIDEAQGAERAALWEIELPGGTVTASFPLADGLDSGIGRAPVTARLMGPADTVRYEVAKCGACGEAVSVHGHDGLAVGYVTNLGVRCGPCVSKPAPSQPSHAPAQDPDGIGGPGSADTPPDAAVRPGNDASPPAPSETFLTGDDDAEAES